MGRRSARTRQWHGPLPAVLSGDWLALAAIAGLVTAGVVRRSGSADRVHRQQDVQAAQRAYAQGVRELDRWIEEKWGDDPKVGKMVYDRNLQMLRRRLADDLKEAWKQRVNEVARRLDNRDLFVGNAWRQRVLAQPYVYHFTSYDRLPSIRREGLRSWLAGCVFFTTPGGIGMWSKFAGDKRMRQIADQRGTYFNQAERSAGARMRAAPIALRVSTAVFDPEKLRLDKVGTIDGLYSMDYRAAEAPEDAFAVCYRGVVPRDALEWARVRPDPHSGRMAIEGSWTRVVRGSSTAVARRSRYTDDGWVDTPAHLTKGHGQQLATHRARPRARLQGERLGQGNFGVTHRVDTLDGPRVVKLPASHNIHGQPWDLAQLRREFLHEAGVANELTDLGYRIVPQTTFVDKPIDMVLGVAMDRDPIPFALVREYGELVTSMSPAEFSKLERALFDLENETGWYPADHLFVLRRPDGSFYIGDVGLWSVPGDASKQPIGWHSNLSHLTPLLASQVVSEQAGRVPSMSGMLYQVQRLDKRDFEDDPDDWWRSHVDDLREDAAKRRTAGLTVPVEVQSFLAQAGT